MNNINTLEKSMYKFYDNLKIQSDYIKKLDKLLEDLKELHYNYGEYDLQPTLTQYEEKEIEVIKNNIIYIILKYCTNDILKEFREYKGKKVNDYNIHMLKSSIEYFLNTQFVINLDVDSIVIYYQDIYIDTIDLNNNNDFYNDTEFLEIEKNATLTSLSNYGIQYIENRKDYINNLLSILKEIQEKEMELNKIKNKLKNNFIIK